MEEYGEAIEYDLLDRGYRLRWLGAPARDFNWRDLYVLVRGLGQGSALHKARHGEEEDAWTLSNHLLARQVENTDLLVWMKTEDASRRPARNRPKPIYRPGVEDDSKKSIGNDKLPVDEMLAFLGKDYAALMA